MAAAELDGMLDPNSRFDTGVSMNGLKQVVYYNLGIGAGKPEFLIS